MKKIIKVCPKCHKKTDMTFPALSRRDNKTDICSKCGEVEAFEDLVDYKSKRIIGQIEGQCPKCKKECLDYDAGCPDDNMMVYPYRCASCGANGKEWYRMEFIESVIN